jgi:hypothetical protein
VGSFEITSIDEQQHIPMHLMASVQDTTLVQATGYGL